MMNDNKITDAEQRALAEFYRWLEQRAAYLRQNENKPAKPDDNDTKSEKMEKSK